MTDDEIVELVDTCDEWAGRPVTTANEIAEQLDVTRQAAHNRLSQLEDEGRVSRYQPGRSVVWFTS